MANADELKRAAGIRAAELIQDGMVVGLGTGSTVRYLLEAIVTRRARGELQGIVGIPTSGATQRIAEATGIPLTDLTRHPEIDLALDGADEFDPSVDLIKGLGGALLREKVVASAAADFVALVDGSKRVARLGEKAPLPVEVAEFGLGIQLPFLRRLGCEPVLRLATEGTPFRTDGGNLIIDCRFAGGIPDPHELADALDGQPGIFEHGLFLGMARAVIVAAESGIEMLERS